ncbi:MAG: hypothetical protein U0835_07555 [Isosphaeraceae bacterium]
MSIDGSVHLYIHVSKARPAFEALRKILRKRKSVPGVPLVLPDGSEIRIPAAPEFGPTAWVSRVSRAKDERGEVDEDEDDVELDGPDTPIVLAEHTRISGLVASVLCHLGRGRQRPTPENPLDTPNSHWIHHKGKTYVDVVLSLDVERDREYVEISFQNVHSGDVSVFDAEPFRARMAHVLVDGEGLAALCAMGDWYSYGERSKELHVPRDRKPDQAGIDGFVAYLHEAL